MSIDSGIDALRNEMLICWNPLKCCNKTKPHFLWASFCSFMIAVVLVLFFVFFGPPPLLSPFPSALWFRPSFLQQICFFAVFHLRSFVWPPSPVLHVTTPLAPPSPLFLCLAHLIIIHSQIWLNVLSWKGCNSRSLSFSPNLLVSFAHPACLLSWKPALVTIK